LEILKKKDMPLCSLKEKYWFKFRTYTGCPTDWGHLDIYQNSIIDFSHVEKNCKEEKKNCAGPPPPPELHIRIALYTV
jgi:hypothetical protein